MLDAERVHEIFGDCLFREGEDTSTHIPGEGIMALKFGYHPDRLEKHSEEIVAMLEELPDTFKKSGGGGMSFLNACEDKHGNQWTDIHNRMEQLFSLGNAIGKVTFTLPREYWKHLPGGMPYITVDV